MITGGDVEICTLWVWWGGHEIDVKVRSWATRLLVAFASELLVVVWVHSCFYFNLLVANRLGSSFAVQTNSLFLVTYRLDAASVEFLKCGWYFDLYGWHWWELWLVDTPVS